MQYTYQCQYKSMKTCWAHRALWHQKLVCVHHLETGPHCSTLSSFTDASQDTLCPQKVPLLWASSGRKEECDFWAVFIVQICQSHLLWLKDVLKDSFGSLLVMNSKTSLPSWALKLAWKLGMLPVFGKLCVRTLKFNFTLELLYFHLVNVVEYAFVYYLKTVVPFGKPSNL